jgi:hypothetical protein
LLAIALALTSYDWARDLRAGSPPLPPTPAPPKQATQLIQRRAIVLAPTTNATRVIWVVIQATYTIQQSPNGTNGWQFCTNVVFPAAPVTLAATNAQMFFRGCWRTCDPPVLSTNFTNSW